jgi:hypothetical protein
MRNSSAPVAYVSSNWSAALVRVFPSVPRDQAAVCARPRIQEGQAARICANSDLVQLVPAEVRFFSPHRRFRLSVAKSWITR